MKPSPHTLTFSRNTFNRYVELYSKTISRNSRMFIFKGTVVSTEHAKKLIDQFEPLFKDPTTKTATINYPL